MESIDDIHDAIHVQTKERKEDNNAKGIGTPKAYDCWCAVHDVWWCVKPILIMYKQPQPKQWTHGHYWWDG